MIALDTHVLIWDALAPERLSQASVQAIANANQHGEIVVSDITIWEIAMLVQKGRLKIETDCQTFLDLVLQANKIRVVPISTQIASLAIAFPKEVNKDPADRLILATSLVEDVVLVTVDRNLRSLSMIETLW